MTQPTPPPTPGAAPGTDQPPAQSSRHALVLTAALLLLWASITLFARPLHPVVASVAEHFEVAWGLDVSKGERERE